MKNSLRCLILGGAALQRCDTRFIFRRPASAAEDPTEDGDDFFRCLPGESNWGKLFQYVVGADDD